LVPVRELVTLNYGKALLEKNRNTGKIPVYGTNGQCGWHDKALALGPGVILGRKGMGNLGVEWCESAFWVIDTAYYVTPNRPDVDLKFFYYLTKYVGLNHLKDGTSNPSLNRDTFSAQLFPHPPVADQKAIAQTLSAFDGKIHLNCRMNATLEAMARALFRAWFVDFEPVRAKGAGAESFPVMPHELFNSLPQQLVESQRGMIPDGWKVGTIGEQVRVVGGGTPSTATAEYWDNGTHFWSTPKDLSKLESPVLIETERRITDAGLERISSGLLPRRTVLLSSRAPIGYLALAEIPTAINQGFIAMVCEKRLPPEYVLNWCAENMDEIKGRANGTTFMEVSKANFRTISLIVPDEAILRAFLAIVRPMYDLIAANLRENRTLADTRDTLLPKLMTGEVRVQP
jgi:type I restriction enzyme S subunit